MSGVLVDTTVWVDHFRRGQPSLVDLRLLASVLLTPGARLWTLDRRLAALAQRHAVAHPQDVH